MKQSIKKITGDAPDREGGPRKKETKAQGQCYFSYYQLFYYYIIILLEKMRSGGNENYFHLKRS